MGYVMVAALCCSCGQLVIFNPNKVPSVRIRGEKQPLCKKCVDLVNEKRKLIKMPLFKIDPEAYEPANEDEIQWK